MSTAPKTKLFKVGLRVNLRDIVTGYDININSINPGTQYPYLNNIVLWINNQLTEKGGYYNDRFKCIKKSGTKYPMYIHYDDRYKKDGASLSASYKYIIDGNCGTEATGLKMLDLPTTRVTMDKEYILSIQSFEIQKKTKAQGAQQRVQKKQRADAAKAAAKAQKKQKAEALRKMSTKLFKVGLRVNLHDATSGKDVDLNSINPDTENPYLNDVVVWVTNQFTGINGSYRPYFNCVKKSGTKYRNNIHFNTYNKNGAVLSARYKYVIDGSCGPLSNEYNGLHMLDLTPTHATLDKDYVLTIQTSEIQKKTVAQKAAQKAQKKQRAEAAKAQKKQAADALKKAKKQAADALKKAKKQAADALKKANFVPRV